MTSTTTQPDHDRNYVPMLVPGVGLGLLCGIDSAQVIDFIVLTMRSMLPFKGLMVQNHVHSLVALGSRADRPRWRKRSRRPGVEGDISLLELAFHDLVEGPKKADQEDK